MTPDINWIAGPWQGRLAISARPRAGDWLQDEVQGWKAAGVDVIVSFLTAAEDDELDLGPEARNCREAGLVFISHPIEDRGLPVDRNQTTALIRSLDRDLARGRTVLLHCRQGVGRSGMMAAALLVAHGENVDQAFKSVAAARGREVPDTREQRDWVARFADELSSATLAR